MNFNYEFAEGLFWKLYELYDYELGKLNLLKDYFGGWVSRMI